MTASQKSMIAGRARECYDEQAKERQKRKAKSVPVIVPEQKGDSRDLAGKAVGVSGTLVDRATNHAPHRRYDRTSDGLEGVGGTDVAGSSIERPRPKWTPAMKCPHCHVEMHGLDHHTMILAEDMDGWWGVIRQKCPACERLIFELACGQTRTSGNGDLIGSAAKKRILAYPRSGARTPPTEVPDKFADDFKEAAIVLSDSPKASAALGRRCLQNILHNHLGIRKANLSQEIDELLKTPGFPSHLAEAVDGVRIIGNFAAHPLKSTAAGTIIDVEPGEADWTLDVLDGLFDFYFVQPEILKKRRDNLNAKLAAAGKPPMK